jgi:hypothetical protein
MMERITKAVKHWAIMQVIHLQSHSGRKRMRRLIGVWFAVLAALFVLMSAELYVDDTRLKTGYTASPKGPESISPAR